jgi:hypothetical protein
LPDIEASFDHIAKLQQLHAKSVTTGFGSIDKPAQGQVVQDPVRGRRMKPSLFADLFQRNRVLVGGQNVQEGKSSLQHLNGWGGGLFVFHVDGEGLGSFREEKPLSSFCITKAPSAS